MGGPGSGGWNCSGRPAVEHCPRLSIADLLRYGALTTGAKGSLCWGDSEVHFHTVSQNALAIQWPNIHQANCPTIRLQWRTHKRHFGGAQYYLICPDCCAARRHLYFWGGLSCRECLRLGYSTRRARGCWRMHLKIGKLARRLSSKFEWGQVQPPLRPKGMHSSTYAKIAERQQLLMLSMYEQDLNEVRKALRIQNAVSPISE